MTTYVCAFKRSMTEYITISVEAIDDEQAAFLSEGLAIALKTGMTPYPSAEVRLDNCTVDVQKPVRK